MERPPDTVDKVMSGDVVTVETGDSVRHAVRAMVDRDIGSVVVVSRGKAVGVFTERDLLRHALDDRDILDRSVEEVMSSPVVSLHPATDIVEIFEAMDQHKIRRIPVLEDGSLVGVVTERDLLRWVRQVASE